MKFALVISALAVALTGCGAGGGGNPDPNPNTLSAVQANSKCVVKPAKTSDTYRSAILDMRFEQSDVNDRGYTVNSYNAVTPYIDKIDCVGFDTVIFQTNIPIDINTGNLMIYDWDAGHFNRDKSLPKDFWQLIKYSKNKGLKVFVKAIPVNYINDDTICPGCNASKYVLPTTFSTVNFFNSLSSYETMLAQEAEKYKVDGFYIGVHNLGLDTTLYITDWDRVITQVKTVYTGKLIYQSCYQCSTDVWNKVDIVSLGVDNAFSDLPNSALSEIVNHATVVDFISYVKTNFVKYSKPIIIDSIMINTSATSADLYSMSQSNQSNQSFANMQTNYPQQAVQLSAVLEIVGYKLNNVVKGISFNEYMPWGNASWIQHPTNQIGVNFNLVMLLGFDLYHNDSAQAKLSEYFQQPWGYYVLH